MGAIMKATVPETPCVARQTFVTYEAAMMTVRAIRMSGRRARVDTRCGCRYFHVVYC